VVDQVVQMVNSSPPTIYWPYLYNEDVYDWQAKMSKSGVFGDEISCQVIANIIGRDIIIIPTKSTSCTVLGMYSIVKANELKRYIFSSKATL
jgi:hypothetical protein